VDLFLNQQYSRVASSNGDLRELFVTVTGSETVVTEQESDRARAPIDEQAATVESEAISAAREDGLQEAVADSDTGE
jgi:hypothetical protein